MINVLKYELKNNSSYAFLCDNLNKVNSLCSEMLNLVPFKDGVFFTFLPERVNEFRSKIILSELNLNYQNSLNIPNGFSSSMKEIVATFLINEMNVNKKLNCVFDEVLRKVSDKEKDDWFINYGMIHEDDVYYLFKNKEVDLDLIFSCLKHTNNGWHSMCVLTEASVEDYKCKKISMEKISEIATKTQVVVVRAFDGEGYLFWKLSDSHV